MPDNAIPSRAAIRRHSFWTVFVTWYGRSGWTKTHRQQTGNDKTLCGIDLRPVTSWSGIVHSTQPVRAMCRRCQ